MLFRSDFRSGRVILQQPIEREQMVKLLTDGKTDLLTKFISTKTKRPFKAYLVVERKKDEVKVAFDFPPREPKAGKAGKEVVETPAAPAAKVTKTAVATKSVKATKAPAKKK